jgi:thymidylate synthase
MLTIERDTIGEAHESIIGHIIESGIEINTKHGITLEYPEPVAIKILKPFNEPVKSSAYSFPFEGMKIYAEQLLEVTPLKFDYNCGNRWFDYFSFKNLDKSVFIYRGDGDKLGFNQIEENVINELKRDNSSRRAVVISLQPELDSLRTHIPCITQLQFLIRDKKLNCIVYIRSNDMLSAWGADAYALSQVFKYVANKLNIQPGYLEIISISAHIYYKRDEPDLLKFRKKINR